MAKKEKAIVSSDISEELNDIISKKPDFLEKRLLLLIATFLLLLVLLSVFIKYPDVIKANGTLMSENSPKEIVVKESGRIEKLFVKNGQLLSKGDIIGWIESSSNPKEIIRLSKVIEEISTDLNDNKVQNMFLTLSSSEFQNLGEIQSDYQVFVNAYRRYERYIINNLLEKEKKFISEDINTLNNINNNLQDLDELYSADVTLQKEIFQSDKSLYKKQIISLDEYVSSESKFINKQTTQKESKSSFFNNEMQIREKKKNIISLDAEIIQEKVAFEQALYTFKSHLDLWIQNYILKAPASGKIVFSFPLQEKMYLQKDKLIGYMTFDNTSPFISINIPQANSGKIRVGMQTQVRFSAYPFQEYGFVHGYVAYISEIAVDSIVLGTINIDNRLITNRSFVIPYKNGLDVDALIITENQSLLKRFYNNIIKATSMK